VYQSVAKYLLASFEIMVQASAVLFAS